VTLRESTISIQQIPISVSQAGAGHPILLLHGWPSDHRNLVAHFEPIFDARPGWRRIYPDLPGMGRTPAPDWLASMDQVLAIALDLADTVAPDQPLAVVGASWGAYLALGMLHHRPDRFSGALFMVPKLSPDPKVEELRVITSDPRALADLTPEERPWTTRAVVQTAETLAAFRETVKPGLAAADHAALERIEEQFDFSFDAADLASPFAGPSLFLAGRHDVAVGYRDGWPLLDRFPRATFAVLDRAGHALAVEQRDLFRALTGEWLDRLEESLARG
jgi:pimeloyl-ACP methyl ester carboxylesterase